MNQMIIRMPGAILCLLLLASPVPGAAEEPADETIAQEVDALMRAQFDDDEPGAAVIVTRRGRVIFREGYGLADLELGVPVSPDMIFRIGSVTKQFTAVAVLMLVEEGRLALDDPIVTFLKDYPAHVKEVTVEHLLTHTSGIVSYTSQAQFHEMQRRDYTVAEMIARFQDEPLEFTPGHRWRYSNSGYFLLGAIIEQVSGETWAGFLQTHIFDPLGMKDTHADRHDRIIPGRIRGYELDPDGGWTTAAFLSMTQPYAAGAMLSTVDDLAKWDRALSADKLLDPDALARAWTAFLLADGSSSGYGYGWGIGEWLGSRVISHGGGINGFLCHTIHCPDEEIFVAVLTNRSGKADPGGIARRAAAIAMGRPWEPEQVTVPEEVLARYPGVYRVDDETTYTLTLEEDRLFSQRTAGVRRQALPMAHDAFFFEESFTHFAMDVDDEGMVRGMTVRAMGSLPTFAVLTDEEPLVRQAIALDPTTLDRYPGRYELAPGFILTVTREGDELWTQATGQPRVRIYPESSTEFFLKDVDARLEFAFDDSGQATGLTLYQGGHEIPAKRLQD